MQNSPWATAVATGIGSLPGTDPGEADRVIVGELPDLPHLAELPSRGVGADMIGRTAGLLVDLAVEVVPSGYRVASRPGHDHRRAVDFMRFDLDAFQDAVENAKPPVVKVQLTGPWTLASLIELPRGHRVLTDPGALREFAASLSEGLALHVAEVAKRTGASVVVQLDEPMLPSVLRGMLPTPSKLGYVAPVPEPDARELLGSVVEAARRASGQPVVVHCCADKPPLSLLRSAGADGLAFDLTLLRNASAEVLDQIGETWDDGAVLFLGLVPTVDPTQPPTLKALAQPAFDLVDKLGFARSLLAERAVATPTCGLAGATHTWARRAMGLSRELAKAFVEPPESW
ncbi:methionine synthase [Kutzneria sp. 744]|uniref:methionine synthase n=1 Tax=Kutzneria sp. (strain 744) TaxID=345341 RepID=UPI0003EEB4FB|nr:methionine synthase [Kutzneria sp. 744]EWM16260.1 vitamin-B12 independent methionine synthase [Kutzneria sp. 744]